MAEQFSYELVWVESRGFIWFVFSGEPTLADLPGVFESFREHPAYRADLDELLDMRGASMRRFSPNDFEEIRHFLSRQEDRFGTKQAAVVGSDLDFGVYRMFDSRSDESVPQQRRVFRSVEEALEWLRPGCSRELLASHGPGLPPAAER